MMDLSLACAREARSLQAIRETLGAWPAFLHAPGIAGALTSLAGVQARLEALAVRSADDREGGQP